MTRKEWVQNHYPKNVGMIFTAGVSGCPHHYPHLRKIDSMLPEERCKNPKFDCSDCWNTEIPNTEKENKMIKKTIDANGNIESIEAGPHILDSGDRTEFESGAVRDMHEGKGDMASIPWEAILRLSIHYENGAKKYDRWNFRKGIPVSSFIDSACRHLAKYQCGCDDEDHLAAAAFNILGAMLMENTKPEMQDLPLREGKNTFDYFKKKEVN